MQPVPTDKKLYEKVKSDIYKKNPTHSAYRSGLIVKKYKELGGKYKGNKSKSSLKRWFDEKWLNQRGEVGYKKISDVYRPTKRITKKTPTTFSELSAKEIKKAQHVKKTTGRVKQFKPKKNAK